MLSLHEIIKYYPPSLQPFKRFIVREYLQYKILEIVFASHYGRKLVFLGGTCLRIVHGTERFSEDLDFDNLGLSVDEFTALGKRIRAGLLKEGYKVEIKNVVKGAFHCYIKFPSLLYKHGLSNYQQEKIHIQLDTEPQNFHFVPEEFFLNKFDVFCPIYTTPLALLLSQKLYAILNRKRNKGRDFFDVIHILGLGIKPDYSYLTQKLGIKTANDLKNTIAAHCSTLNMEAMAKDVEPFLFKPVDSKRVRFFLPYLSQATL